MNITDYNLTFDDVLLKPQYSTILSRSEVDLSVSLCKGINLRFPCCPANMADIVGKDVMVKMYNRGAMSIMHRFCGVDEQISTIMDAANYVKEEPFNYFGVSVGVKKEDYLNLEKFNRFGIKIVCVDIAHLDSILGLAMVEHIAAHYPHMLLIAGNIATGEAAERAWRAGADVVKVGVGSSGICSTRLMAGAGVPQLSAIMDVAKTKEKMQKELGRKLCAISDGGHKNIADCVKALCFADLVMLGGMLAGSDETPGAKVIINDEVYKSYIGSSALKASRIEGVKGLVKSKGPINNILNKISDGIQSGCSYQNCKNLTELKENPTFIRISNAAIAESGIYGVRLNG